MERGENALQESMFGATDRQPDSPSPLLKLFKTNSGPQALSSHGVTVGQSLVKLPQRIMTVGTNACEWQRQL